MLAYCVGELRLSDQAAKKRIRVARAGHRCPGVFAALAEGRVHLSGLVALATHLTPENADELLAEATHRSLEDIERLLAARYPKHELPTHVDQIGGEGSARTPLGHEMPGPLGSEVSARTPDGHGIAATSAPEGAPGHLDVHARVTPLSAEAYAVQFTRGREDDELFRYLQSLLGHQVRRGDIAAVYARAVKELITRMERVRFGACAKPRSGKHNRSNDPRRIPAEVKRAVWQRDGGQCTFVSESGHRCEARGDVEFDHVIEVARGGQATEAELRLRCRGHNQLTAERAFGAGFMARKRKEAAEARAAAKAERARVREEKEIESRLQPHEEEVVPWICALGMHEREARIAARRCRDMAGARLEDRVKRALTFFGARISRTVKPELCAGPSTSPTQAVAPVP
jgi:5-methylcytosine-specific restriction endonuclease McrA